MRDGGRGRVERALHLRREPVDRVLGRAGPTRERRCFAPGEMIDMARQAGFREVRNVRQRDAIPAGLWQRPDSLWPADLAVLCHVAV